MMRSIPRKLLFGRSFQQKLALLLSSEKWSLEELEAFQRSHLTQLVDHAYRTVPYYHRIFREYKIDPTDFHGPEDLKRLPVLTSEIIRNHFDELKSVDAEQYQAGPALTSGSTGKPLRFMLDQQSREMDLASVWRHRSWAGIDDLNVKIATFRGDFAPEYGKTTRLWSWDGKTGELVFNTYSLTNANIKEIASRLNEFKPEMVRGYPHSLYILSRGIQRMNIPLTFQVKAIQSSSEHLSQMMRETIENTFSIKIFDWYGQSENVVSAGQCECGLYHQTMEAGVMSLLEDHWGMENLVGTSLWNFSVPFINYEVGDMVKKGDGGCECGRHHLTIESIEGRSKISDILVTPDGRPLCGAGMDRYLKSNILPGLEEIPDYLKLTQESAKEFSVYVFRTEGLSEKSMEHIAQAVGALLGEEADVKVKVLEKPPEARKWRNVESKIDLNTFNSNLDNGLR